MAVIKKCEKVFWGSLFFLSSINNAFAEMMLKGATKVKTIFNFYHQNGDEGYQVYNGPGREEVNVVEPMIFMEHQITDETAINAHFIVDLWTAASDTKLDARTGASGAGITNQSRVAGNLGFRTETGKWSYSGAVGVSSEYDYKSINGSVNVSRSFAKDNFTLGFGLQYYLDQVRLFPNLATPSNAAIKNGHVRNILATSVSASQILTRRDIALLTLNYIKASGRLESTASSVEVAGNRQVERLPGERDRYALSTSWVHAFNANHALNSQYRYYWDDWDLDAHTLRLAYLWEYNENEDLLEFSVRYHHQSGVKYFKKSFTRQESFMTSDSDMDQFDSYEIGAYNSRTLLGGESFNLLGLSFENLKWSNGATYAKRSNGLQYGYLQTALSFEF